MWKKYKNWIILGIVLLVIGVTSFSFNIKTVDSVRDPQFTSSKSETIENKVNKEKDQNEDKLTDNSEDKKSLSGELQGNDPVEGSKPSGVPIEKYFNKGKVVESGKVKGDVKPPVDETEVNTSVSKKCTIYIDIKTIEDNLNNLEEGKERYLTEDYILLNTTEVEYYEGETVFDVLLRECQKRGIHMESSWTPMYNSAYVEGINNLYEFDCGNESGWMYKVNGVFPNYGSSRYVVLEGDVIEWVYTCNGLGKDVGCEWMS